MKPLVGSGTTELLLPLLYHTSHSYDVVHKDSYARPVLPFERPLLSYQGALLLPKPLPRAWVPESHSETW